MSIPPEAVFGFLRPDLLEKWIKSTDRTLLLKEERLRNSQVRAEYVERFRTRGWYRIEDCLSEVTIRGLQGCMETLEGEGVHVGDGRNQTWLEYRFDESNNLPKVIVENTILREFLFLPFDRNFRDVREIKSWINCYRSGEYIPEHTDSDGFLQLLIGLETPENADEPLLEIEGREVPLNPGDLVIFQAAECTHKTRPVPDESAGNRVNAAVRFCK